MNRDNDIYKQYIIEKSDEFKKSIIDNLECKIVGDKNIRSSYDKFLETKTHIKNHVNIINNGVLIDNENKLYGQCDLLVRIGYIKNIYPEIDIEITPININKYVVIGIKYIKINKTSENYYKGNKKNNIELTLCVNILNNIQNYNEGVGYIIGRENKIVKVKLDNDIENHIRWYIDLKENGEKWTIEPANKIELYPNMKLIQKNSWSDEIIRIANKYNEVTLIRGISYKNRNNSYKLIQRQDLI